MRSTVVVTLALSVLATSDITGQETTIRYTEGIVLGTREDPSASVAFADVDGNGDLDIVMANGRHWPAQNEIFLNNGRGRFMVARPLGEERATSYEAPLGDLDGDGDLDVMTGNDMARNLVLLNSGTGHFHPAGTVGDLARPTRGMTLADLNEDGSLDVLIVNRGAENEICFNDGKAVFDECVAFGYGRDATIEVAVAD